MPSSRRWVWIVVIVALVHAAIYILVQRSDWDHSWTDQGGYQLLARSLAQTGRFTRAAPGEPFAPEAIRTPVYPMFVALVYRMSGTTSHEAVAVAQALLFAALCLLVYAIGRRLSGERCGRAAGLATALFPPLPYFGALVMTELWTAFAFTVAVWLTVRAIQDGRAALYAGAGVACAATALSRPAFVLLPIAVVGADVAAAMLSRPIRVRVAGWTVLGAAFAVCLLPWLAYNYRHFHRITISPAGGVGRGLWEGSWQGRWDGRVQAQLTDIADQTADRAELDVRVHELARANHAAPDPMLEYAHQWQDIRRIWDTPTDPNERAMARVRADDEYRRVAFQNISRDPASHIARRLTRGILILWTAEIPVPYNRINAVPRWIVRVMWGVQAVVVGFGIAGVFVLLRRGRVREGSLLGFVMLYVTAVHAPLLTEARQSLPAMPSVLVLAAVAVVNLTPRSFPLEPQVHEREHVGKPRARL